MRRALAAVLLLALAGLWWFMRASTPRGVGISLRPAEERVDEAPTELVAPPVPEEPDATGGEASGAALRSAAAPRKAPPEALRAPVRGRVVVAETGDPIERSFALRLRTLDLRQSESLVTSAAGTFTSAGRFPRARLLALVKDPERNELVDHEALFEPAAEDEWLVRVPDARWPTFATARVVDRHGVPLEGVGVGLVGRGADLPWIEGESFEEGLVELAGLRRGEYRLLLQGAWSRVESRVLLDTGPNDLGDLVLDEPMCADLRLSVVLDDPGRPPDAWFELREAGAERSWRFPASHALREADGSYRIYLEVPSGRYELTTHAFDGRVYEPATLIVSPPAVVELRGRGTVGRGTLFRARDARTGEALAGFQVFGRYGRTWGLHSARTWRRQGRVTFQDNQEEVRLRPGYDAWVLCATGYRAAAGSFTGAGDTITVALEPGWSELFQFEDAAGDSRGPREHRSAQDPPVLAGVELQIDGQPVGTADAQGFFLLHAEREPEAIEFRLRGWRVVNEEYLSSLRTVVLARSQ